MSVDCFQSLVSKFHDECNSSSGQLTFGLMSAGFARLPIHSMVDLICMLTVVVLESAEHGPEPLLMWVDQLCGPFFMIIAQVSPLWGMVHSVSVLSFVH